MQRRHGVAARHIKYRTKSFKGGFSGGTIDSMMAMMEAGQKDQAFSNSWATPIYSTTPFEEPMDLIASVRILMKTSTAGLVRS